MTVFRVLVLYNQGVQDFDKDSKIKIWIDSFAVFLIGYVVVYFRKICQVFSTPFLIWYHIELGIKDDNSDISENPFWNKSPYLQKLLYWYFISYPPYPIFVILIYCIIIRLTKIKVKISSSFIKTIIIQTEGLLFINILPQSDIYIHFLALISEDQR